MWRRGSESIADAGRHRHLGAVRDHVGNRLDLAFEDIGEQALKNIERPVRVYRVALDQRPQRSAGRRCPLAERSARRKPSIAVLPFTNMSGDPEQEYFADGITEDIITDLSKVSGLSVIARNSVFTYKGKHADVQEVGRRFNVTTVLEGSVRKAGQRVRINAQLIDARDGTHLWADRYDRDLTDIFAIQDEITKTIVEQLKVRLLPQEKKAIEAAPTRSVDAYNYYLQGRHLFHLHTQPHVLLAQRMFRKAVELDPRYARAYAGLADCAWFLYNNHTRARPSRTSSKRARKRWSSTRSWRRRTPRTEWRFTISAGIRRPSAEFERAIAIDPNLFEAYYFYAFAARDAGDLETSVKMDERASEIDTRGYRVRFNLAQTYWELGRIEESTGDGEGRHRVGRASARRASRAVASRGDRRRGAGPARRAGARA